VYCHIEMQSVRGPVLAALKIRVLKRQLIVLVKLPTRWRRVDTSALALVLAWT